MNAKPDDGNKTDCESTNDVFGNLIKPSKTTLPDT